MKIYTINGSPRVRSNVAVLLDSFEAGAKSAGSDVETVRVDLYTVAFTGCRECFLCKLKGGRNYGMCGYRDGAMELVHEISRADGFAIGAPVFFGDINGQTKAFLERLMYPFEEFSGDEEKTIAPKKLRSAILYSMNVTEDFMKADGYPAQFARTENWLAHIFGHAPSVLYSVFTKQFSDYSKYVADFWDADAKEAWHREQFPKDCKKAFDMGREMAEQILAEEKK